MNENKQIIRFLSAQTISLLGSSLVQYAIIWYITLSTQSGIMMMIATLCGFLPQVLISLYAGVWVDHYNRKKLIMYSDGAIALTTLILAILFIVGFKEIWLLFIALFMRSMGAGIQTPSVNAIIPQIVSKNKLMKINGINSTLNALIMFLSPALSAAILMFMSLEATFLIDVLTAIIGIIITSTIKIIPHESIHKNSMIEGIKAGFLYVRENEFIKKLLFFQIIILILISPSAFLTPLMVSRTFGLEVWRLSASEMIFSAGAALGGALIAWWGGFKNRIYTTILAGGAYGLLMIFLGLSPIFLIYLFFNFLIGITMPIYNAPITVLIQEKAHTQMHGRIFSFMQISTSCALPLGMVIFGPLADRIKVQDILIVCGFLVLITTLLTFYLITKPKRTASSEA